MESLAGLLLLILLSIVFIIVASSVLKIHPFISIILAAFIVGFGSGIPAMQLISYVNEGFGGILAYIGLIVTLGTIIGVFLEQSGALNTVANKILSTFGQKRSIASMAILGSLIGIPVFCDSGFVILSRLSKMVASRQGINTASTSLALASGLYTTHTLVPPTPGPIAAAGNIGAANHLGIIILFGFSISIPVMLISIWFSRKFGSRLNVENNEENLLSDESETDMGFLWAITPILLPIAFITLASVFKLLALESTIINLFYFLGHPLVALSFGLLMAMLQISSKVKFTQQGNLITKGIVQSGPILLITGAGGAFGAVLKATSLSELLAVEVNDSVFSGAGFLILAYLIAALLKTAQGSSTSALVITSSLLAPLTAQAGFESPTGLALLVMALGAGAMTVSHANDSYFWIVTKFSGFSLNTGYRGFTLLTFIQGLMALTTILLLYIILTP